MNTNTRRIIPTLACFALLAVGVADAEETSPGVWQKHQYVFHALTFTSTYSCDGLADKLKILLLASGARADVKAQSGACSRGFGRPDKFAQADLTFYTLVPQAGAAEAAPVDPQRADGQWRPVTLAEYSPRDLRVGDCELVDLFRTQVLPMFTIRNVNSHLSCIPYQNSGSVIDLRFESFAAKNLPDGDCNHAAWRVEKAGRKRHRRQACLITH